MADIGEGLLVVCGLMVTGIGVFFVAFRPPLLPEDRRYMALAPESLEAVLPNLGLWLQKVFLVMGGYMVATGVLTIHLALTGSATAQRLRGSRRRPLVCRLSA